MYTMALLIIILILNQFWQNKVSILKLRISSFQPCIICEDPWWFIYEIAN